MGDVVKISDTSVQKNGFRLSATTTYVPKDYLSTYLLSTVLNYRLMLPRNDPLKKCVHRKRRDIGASSTVNSKRGKLLTPQNLGRVIKLR